MQARDIKVLLRGEKQPDILNSVKITFKSKSRIKILLNKHNLIHHQHTCNTRVDLVIHYKRELIDLHCIHFLACRPRATIDTALNKEQDELSSLNFLNTEPHSLMSWDGHRTFILIQRYQERFPVPTQWFHNFIY